MKWKPTLNFVLFVFDFRNDSGAIFKTDFLLDFILSNFVL